MRLRERVGEDIPNRFDYQLAVAMSYLIDTKEPIMIILETLEDFAIVKDVNTDNEIVDIYQVKSVGAGLMTKSTLLNEDVYGKLYLTDKFFDNKSNSLNIICNSNLKGISTEKLDRFKIFDRFTQKEKEQILDNVKKYFTENKIVYDKKEINSSKLVFIKTNLPLKDTLFEKTLVGTVNELLNKDLYEQSINPAVVFKTLKEYFIKVRNNSIEQELSFDDAKSKRGVSSDILDRIIKQVKQSQVITKTQLVSFCNNLFNANEILNIKNEYSNYIAKSNDLSDSVFIKFKEKIIKDFEEYIKENADETVGNAIKTFIANYPETTYTKEFMIVCLIVHHYA